MTKIEILLEILGEDKAELIAQDLEDSYRLLESHLQGVKQNDNVAMYDCSDIDNEIKQVKKLMKALKKTYTWYSVEEIQ